MTKPLLTVLVLLFSGGCKTGNHEGNDGQLDVWTNDAKLQFGDAGTYFSDSAIDGSTSIPAHCSDQIQNVDETDIDCGGKTCTQKWHGRCATQQRCKIDGDCRNRICINETCAAPRCDDNVRNHLETDVDCGGERCRLQPAGRCATGKTCQIDSDCANNACVADSCANPTCTDGRKNQNETGIDCGGITCTSRCNNGQPCKSANDCLSQYCKSGICSSKQCENSVKDGLETDIDCGGEICRMTWLGKCSHSQQCLVGGDCKGAVCQQAACATPTCSDSVKNGTETDIDCGGKLCAQQQAKKCRDGKKCLATDGSDCISGHCQDSICQPASCSDSILNHTETDVDCGGACPLRCHNGLSCRAHADCLSSTCVKNLCANASCTNKQQDPGETDIDCGGALCSETRTTRCPVGKKCKVALDCYEGVCIAGVCAPPTCSDAVKNRDETGVDCGGTCPNKCAAGQSCTNHADCQTNLCDRGLCQTPSCNNDQRDGYETDVDCGGPLCRAGWPGRCDPSASCMIGLDCKSSVCTTGLCQVARCDDGVKNQQETDVDCGGATCATTVSGQCANTKVCAFDRDCKSLHCENTTCVASTCTDQRRNGNESDIDCGGNCSTKCGLSRACRNNTDCTNNNCIQGVCTAPTCVDRQKNGTETDVDCGGNICRNTTDGKCNTGQTCLHALDCKSGVCKNKRCQKPTCDDGVYNGDETDKDCGGSCSLKCDTAMHCDLHTDCKSGVCINKTCAAPSCSDRIKNGDETDIDCGGSCSSRCDVNRQCKRDSDCVSTVCINQVCRTCRDGTESSCGNCGRRTCVGGQWTTCQQPQCCTHADCPIGRCSAGTCINMPLSCAKAPVTSALFNAKDYGAKGDGITDDTNAIQAVLDLAAAQKGTAYLPNGTYVVQTTKTPTDVPHALRVNSNTTFWLEPSALIRLSAATAPNKEVRHSVIMVSGASNIGIIGGKIMGDWSDHPSSTLEHGFAVFIRSGSQITIQGTESYGFRGDSLYITSATSTNRSIDILVCDVLFRNNRRQGISVIDAEQITVKNSIFRNISSIEPSAGIDLEPNNLPGQKINNVTIENNLFENNWYGVQIWLFDNPIAEITNVIVRNNMMKNMSKAAVRINNRGCSLTDAKQKYGIDIAGNSYQGNISNLALWDVSCP